MKRRPDLDALIAKHRNLDRIVSGNRNQFISDWNCDNPLAEDLLGPDLVAIARHAPAADSYIYFDDDASLVERIRRFHAAAERLALEHDNILAGPGSSSFLAALAVWLRHCGYTDVYCIPPLYHTLYFLLECVDITVTPIATRHAYDEQFAMALPDRSTVLLFCDPVWYAGKPVSAKHIAAIAEWQRSTKSVVFVDGSFQYMKWSGETGEYTATLDPNLTFRLICPAKILAVPLFRFAYLLHPSDIHDDMMFLYESMVGGSSAADKAFAHRALQVMSDIRLARCMPDYFRTIYTELVARGFLETRVIPECGYFAFARPMSNPAPLTAMDQTFFEADGYPDHYRINLMAARRIYGID